MFKRAKSSVDMDAWVEERLSDYLDGNLTPQDRIKFEAQVKKSERARASLDSMRWTMSLLKQAPPPPLPRQFTLPVTPRAPQGIPLWAVWGLRGVGAAATIAFVVLLATTVLRQPAGSPNTAFTAAAAATSAPAFVALQPTPIATFDQSAAGAAQNSAQAQTPLMITVQPPPDTAIPQPITETPTRVKSASTQPRPLNPNPSANKAQPTDVPPVAAVEVAPSDTPSVFAQSAAADSSVPSTANGAAPAATSDSGLQRTFDQNGLAGTVTATELQVREGPGTQYRSIGGLNQNDALKIIGRSENDAWLLIEYRVRKATQGWVGAAFVQVDGVLDSLPVYEVQGLVSPTPEPTETALPTDTETPAATVTPVPVDNGQGTPPPTAIVNPPQTAAPVASVTPLAPDEPTVNPSPNAAPSSPTPVHSGHKGKTPTPANRKP